MIAMPLPPVSIPTRCKQAARVLISSWAVFSFCVGVAGATPTGTLVDETTIIANARSGKNWLSNGLDYAGTRFSRLKNIDSSNVKKLGLAWSYSLESTRGVEATPIVVDGIMYVTAPWAVVHAIDARTGKRIWTYDPKTPRDGRWGDCCGPVNRGVAVYRGKVYVGSFDARLIAIDAATGKKVWEQDTKTDKARMITITSAPYVVRGKVIIGNGGGEFGVRGYVTAYDAETGEQKWRWFVTPGDPAKPFEDESQAMAALTWDPSTKYWENGGGGNVWNTMAIDTELNLVYFGTGQPGPWAKAKRGAASDGLYTASIVALNLDTGKYAWHYQENPRDTSDYDACMDLILADLKIDNRVRKVILHAPKNGFFYVLDRANGKFISAKTFVDQTWAFGIDPNGRPIETREGTSTDQPFDAVPGPAGAHNWHAMSYSPLTGLVYIPAQNIPFALGTDADWKGQDNSFGLNLAMVFNPRPPTGKAFGRLIAWDPVKQKEAWSNDLGAPWNGGTLVTAGNLVFQGTANAHFKAFNASNGKQLWDTPVGSGVIAAPVTYAIDGKQYVTIAVGWGGVYGMIQRHSEFTTGGTVYTFVVGGKAKMPAFTPLTLGPLLSGVKYDPKDMNDGAALYFKSCVYCHGVPAIDKGGNIANLGYVDKSYIENLGSVLFDKPFIEQGMPDYTGRLSKEDVEKIKAFIQGTADSIRPK